MKQSLVELNMFDQFEYILFDQPNQFKQCLGGEQVIVMNSVSVWTSIHYSMFHALQVSL